MLCSAEKYNFALLLRANGVMDSTLACYAGGPGLIPAVGKRNGVFLALGIRWKVKRNGARHKQLSDIASPCSRNT